MKTIFKLFVGVVVILAAGTAFDMRDEMCAAKARASGPAANQLLNETDEVYTRCYRATEDQPARNRCVKAGLAEIDYDGRWKRDLTIPTVCLSFSQLVWAFKRRLYDLMANN